MEYDRIIRECAELIVNENNGSCSLLQRRLRFGYNRAIRVIEQLENLKILGPFEGVKNREILVTKKELENILISNKL